jgi:hypothetical protein
MKLIFVMILVLGIMAYSANGQIKGRKFADSAMVYKGFGMGGTTASLHNYSKAVDTMGSVIKSPLSNQYLDTLNLLLNSVKPKRHFQQKIGPSYYAAFSKDRQLHRIAVIEGFGIIDLTSNLEYSLRGTPFIRIFNRLIEDNYR